MSSNKNATITRFHDHPDSASVIAATHEDDLHERDLHNAHTADSKPTTSPPEPSPPKTADGKKPCTLCSTPRNVLVRCQIDDSKKWVFVCTGTCWTSVSGGKQDGTRDFPHYKYGGMWKNKRADVPVSAKIKGKAKGEKSEDTGFVARPKYPGQKHQTGKKRNKSLRDDGVEDGEDYGDSDRNGEEEEDDDLRRAIEASLEDQRDVRVEAEILKTDDEAGEGLVVDSKERSLEYEKDQMQSVSEKKADIVEAEAEELIDDEDWVHV